MKLIVLAAVFFIISTVFSMIGMGGGILYVPILLFAGFTFKQAPALSLILILATSTAALFSFWRNKKVDWKLALLIDPPTDIMAFAGGYFSTLIPESVLKACLGCVLAAAGILMLKKIGAGRYDLQSLKWYHWHRQFNDAEYHVNVPLVLTATGAIGIISGMLGITGGIIKLPIMVLLCGVPMDIAVGTSTVMVAVTAMCGLAGHAVNEQVAWTTGIVMAAAAVAGGLVGSRISLRADKARLKHIFGTVVLLIAFKFLIEILRG